MAVEAALLFPEGIGCDDEVAVLALLKEWEEEEGEVLVAALQET